MARWIAYALASIVLMYSCKSYADLIQLEETTDKTLACVTAVMERAKKTSGFQEMYDDLMAASAKIDHDFLTYIIGIMYIESKFNPTIGGPKGENSVGLMQLTPIAVAELNRSRKELPEECQENFVVDKLTDPRYNIKAGSCFFLLGYQRTGTYTEAIILYNGGQAQLKLLERDRRITSITANYVTFINYLKETYCE